MIKDWDYKDDGDDYDEEDDDGCNDDLDEDEDRYRLVTTMVLIESWTKEDGDDDARKQWPDWLNEEK